MSLSGLDWLASELSMDSPPVRLAAVMESTPVPEPVSVPEPGPGTNTGAWPVGFDTLNETTPPDSLTFTSTPSATENLSDLAAAS